MQDRTLCIIRGGGDLATGAAQKLYRAGFPLLLLETERPMAIRRSVALSEAMYEGVWQVEDLSAGRIQSPADMDACRRAGRIPLLADPRGESIRALRPLAVIDAILAKRNLGTARDMAPITIGLGPGFTAGQDVDAVVETMRGHDLGRLLFTGAARPNTGVPGRIGGQDILRVLRAPRQGTLLTARQIGDILQKGDAVFSVDGETVHAPFDGLLRGLIRPGSPVAEGMKVADIDPRTDVDWRTISDKARCIGGSVLEAVCYFSKAIRRDIT